jgi:adenylate cyclase
MSFVLASAKGDRRFRLPEGETLVLGREAMTDLPVLDAGVSRRHAELRASADHVDVRDLGSRNGTWVNGRRITAARVAPGDVVAFGPVELRLHREALAPRNGLLESTPNAPSHTMIRERAMPLPGRAAEGITSRRLEQLVAIAQRLGGLADLSGLLDSVVDGLFETLRADRVAVILRSPESEMITRVARDRDGVPVERSVPRAIVEGVVDRQMALLTHDAAEDMRTAGMSVQQQAVRSALAAPLISNDGRTLGVLYVDNLRDMNAFTDDDLDFLIAYAGIAAAGVEREQAIDQLREAGRVRENFERYFTPHLAERIAASPGRVDLGGERRSVAVLFCDIRGFTAIAESLPSDRMAAQLNEYFAAMVDCVFRHDGALDKFIGDALMAYWGAPIGGANDIAQAVSAACDMQRALIDLNARWTREGRPALRSGIGIHSGDAFVGNIGSPRRLEYTLIGDTVNLANRICALADGSEILVSEAIRESLNDESLSAALVARPELTPPRHLGPSLALWSVNWQHG